MLVALRPNALTILRGVFPRTRFILIPVCAAVLAVSGEYATAIAGSSPVASGATTCNVSKVGRKLGPTYVTSLMETGTSCATAVSLVKAYYRCRLGNGGKKGRCGSVAGFKCSEVRNSIKTQFTAKATCRRNAVTVVHTYTQFT